MDFGLAESSYVQSPEFSPIVVHYYDQEYTIPNDKQEFNIGNVVLTGSGEALCRTINVPAIEGFFEERCVPFWERTS